MTKLIIMEAREFLLFRETAKKYKIPFKSKVKEGMMHVKADSEQLKTIGYDD